MVKLKLLVGIQNCWGTSRLAVFADIFYKFKRILHVKEGTEQWPPSLRTLVMKTI